MSDEKTPTQHDETMAALLTIAHGIFSSTSQAKGDKLDFDEIESNVLAIFDNYSEHAGSWSKKDT